MVTKDQIEEEELTTEEVIDREFVEPQQEVRILPEWEEYPEERPGENLRIEDDQLVWERDGFEARLWSHETTHWKAQITIPREYGKYDPRPVDMKSKSIPEYGFVESVEMDDYAAVGVTLVLQENFQPTYEVNKFIDHLIERKEGAEEREQEIKELMGAARENQPKED